MTLFIMIAGWISRKTNETILKLGGFKVQFITAWIGVPVHEFFHFIAALLSGHQIIQFALFSPNPRTGQLGIVESKFKRTSWYQNYFGGFFISIAPLIGGSVAIYFIIRFFITPISLQNHQTLWTESSFQNIINLQNWINFTISNFQILLIILSQFWQPSLLLSWKSWVAMYFVICIAQYMFPSKQDWYNFRKPFVVLLLLLLTICLVVSILNLIQPSFKLGISFLNRVLPYCSFTFLILSLLNGAIYLSLLLGMIIMKKALKRHTKIISKW
ncbi:MAG: hypothetical protein N2450_06570 [bacterium]|nr:hypothetical protein [bacterium]